jgi:hypothetical protein
LSDDDKSQRLAASRPGSGGEVKKKALPARVGRSAVPSTFTALLNDVKARIQSAQTRAVIAANAELVRLYWDIGRLIGERQKKEGWGASVIPRLSNKLRNELPELKGFSERKPEADGAVRARVPECV